MEKPLNKYERNKYKFLNTVFSLLGKVPQVGQKFEPRNKIYKQKKMK